MKTVTTHHAKTHLSRLIQEVKSGEPIVILSGGLPVAQLTAVQPEKALRPKVGTITSPEIGISEDAFRPLTQSELEDWGL